MKIKGRPLLVGLLVMVAILFSGGRQALAKVQQPNLGPYVYQNNDALTTTQYDHIMAVNRKLKQKEYPQTISLYITDRVPEDLSDSYVNSSGAPFGETFGTEILSDWQRQQAKLGNNINDNKAAQLQSEQSIIIVGVKDHRIGFAPSRGTESYFTDFKYSQLMWGLNRQSRSTNEATQIAAAMQLFNRVAAKISSDKAVAGQSMTWADFRADLYGWLILGAFIIILAIIGRYAWCHRRRNDEPSDMDEMYADGYAAREKDRHRNQSE